MQLVPDWKKAHRWLSVRIAVIIAALSLVQATLPELIQDIPPKVYHWLIVVFALAIGVGRIIQQQGAVQFVASSADPTMIDNPDKP